MWPIKWLEILLGIWILNQNFKIGISLKFICKYMGKVILFNEFCKNFQGIFFFQSQKTSSINSTYLYKSLLSGIFLNSYPIKAHCEDMLLSYAQEKFDYEVYAYVRWNAMRKIGFFVLPSGASSLWALWSKQYWRMRVKLLWQAILAWIHRIMVNMHLW